MKSEPADDSDEDAPILAKRIKTEKVKKAKKKKHQTDDEEDDDYSDAPIKKKVKKEKVTHVARKTVRFSMYNSKCCFLFLLAESESDFHTNETGAREAREFEQ